MQIFTKNLHLLTSSCLYKVIIVVFILLFSNIIMANEGKVKNYDQLNTSQKDYISQIIHNEKNFIT